MCDAAKRARFSTSLRQRLTELRREEQGMRRPGEDLW
jgi:hypothetical protein